jgi:hypothetical protein
LNDVFVVETMLWDDALKNVANSKFAGWEGFGIFKTGKIAYKTTVTMFGIQLKNGII